MTNTPEQLRQSLQGGNYDDTFTSLYAVEQLEMQKERYTRVLDAFEELYGANRDVQLFSAPGRTEVGGNHTDHQRGRVLAAGVNLDIICAASTNSDNTVRIKSEGYREDVIQLDDLARRDSEDNKAISLIRGMLFRFQELGYSIGGFDACTTSNVLKGSGLSSSAAFEVAVGTMLNHLFNDGAISAVEIAQIAQYAENVYFGKPSGLMDQAASSVGGFVAFDFADPDHPVVEPIAFDFAHSGYALCIVDTKGNHADLTPEYAAVPAEMKQVAAFFDAGYLREVDQEQFYSRIAEVRKQCGDRPVLRAIHFFSDNDRVPKQADALRRGDFEAFKQLIIESGRSSFFCLQNVFAVSEPMEQGLSVALAISERLLKDRGAWRVHGGGFAGTIQSFVPLDLLEEYRREMDALFGTGSCYVLNIRPVGGVRVSP